MFTLHTMTTGMDNNVDNISEEDLEKYLDHLFGTISDASSKRLKSKFDAILKESQEQLNKDLEQVFPAHTLPNYNEIVEIIIDFNMKSFKEAIKAAEDEEKIIYQKQLAETQEELKVHFQTYWRYHFFMKERNTFATLTPSKNRCY